MTISCVAAALCLVGAADSNGPTRPITSFETSADLKLLQATDTRIQLTPRHATEGKSALEVQFLSGEWPSVKMTAEAAWDWQGFDGLAMEVTNPGSAGIDFGVRVDDDPQAGATHSRQGMGRIDPGQTRTVVVDLGSDDPMTYGMRGLPTAPGMQSLTLQQAARINLGHVVAFQVFMHHPPSPQTLILDHVRLAHRTVPLDKIIDEFGQYAKADWPGKLKTAGELTERRKMEEAELKAEPSLPDRDRYGGWTKGPTLRATGFFRTEKVNGKWWLVTPEGHLFWSVGMDCVTTSNETFTTGREHMFAWLPGKDAPLSRHIGHAGGVHSGPVKEGATFNFLTANLERKFGAEYQKSWFDLSLARLASWGFNTIANWSDHGLYGNGRMPYVATVHIGGDHARISSGSDYWGKMHDPYDPRFATDTANSLRAIAERVKQDPWCVGYFVDNELSWGGFGDGGGRYGLAYGALAEPPESFAKKAIVAQLKTEYEEVAKLNQAWGTSLRDWSELQASFKPHGALTDAMKADLGAFVKNLALQYFKTVHDELRKLDRHHLYLGCRFAWHSSEAVVAAGEVCDVVSFNIYAPKVDSKRLPVLKVLEKLADKPCIIGEFHFGALDRGMFHPGLVAAADQQARAAMYQAYVGSVLDHPLFVGCHWFQYVDEPVTGRSYDGENYNIGFLTVTDTPYPEMVKAARAVHREAYSRRWGGSVHK